MEIKIPKTKREAYAQLDDVVLGTGIWVIP